MATPVKPEATPTKKSVGGREKKVHGSQKRRRTKAFNIGLDEAEYAQAEAQARAAGLSNAAYGRACVLGDIGPRSKRAPPVNRELMATALADLNRVGNNLNQIAHHLNTGGHPDRAKMADARAELIACLQIILQALGRAE